MWAIKDKLIESTTQKNKKEYSNWSANRECFQYCQCQSIKVFKNKLTLKWANQVYTLRIGWVVFYLNDENEFNRCVTRLTPNIHYGTISMFDSNVEYEHIH